MLLNSFTSLFTNNMRREWGYVGKDRGFVDLFFQDILTKQN